MLPSSTVQSGVLCLLITLGPGSIKVSTFRAGSHKETLKVTRPESRLASSTHTLQAVCT